MNKVLPNSQPDQGILLAGADGHILSADNVLCRLLKYRAEDLEGQSLWAMIGRRAAPAAFEWSVRQNTGEVQIFQVNLSALMAAEQRLYVCTIRQRPEEADDRIGFLAQVVNTLQQAKAEMQLSLDKEQEVSRLKTRFVSLASHEFRTPLSSIQLSAALIERYYDRLDRPQVFRHLHKIRMAIGDLTAILEDFLCLEKIDSEKIELRFEEILLPEFCRELVSEMTLQAKAGQNIVYNHQSEQFMFSLDKKLLRHCLTNLIGNAIKYSPEQVPIHLSSRCTGPQCAFVVSDRGLGIPAEDQPNLFEPFFRAHNVLDIQGTGLGLNIVKRYTELMNGSIYFVSKEQEGTTFTLNFLLPGH